MSPSVRHILPTPLSSFIGRQQEIADVREKLATYRLVTLTSAGGSGKTRLAIEAANQVIDEFEDGLCWVELSALADEDLSIPASRFPAKCAVCLSPAMKEYKLEKTFNYGRRVIPITAYVPMCDAHFQKASFKSPAEKLVGELAVVGGILAGVLAAILLSRLRHRPVGLGDAFFGLIIFPIAWWLISYYAPAFADPVSKKVRAAVKITSYHPGAQTVRLEFRQDQIAQGMDVGSPG